MRISGVTIGILLALALVSGSLLHSLAPHTHSHDASGGEAYVWQSLHSSLRHEDKKASPVSDVLILLSAVIIAAGAVFVPRATLFVSSLQDSLRRGIMPHRRFG